VREPQRGRGLPRPQPRQGAPDLTLSGQGLDASHFLVEDRPELVAGELARFLDRSSTHVREVSHAGTVQIEIEGRPTLTLHTGDPFLIPPRTPHNALDLGPDLGQMLSTYIVETDEPIATVIG
jgi:hypothetical protein